MSEAKFSNSGFELVTCSRCGGSGRYSFNLMHGSRCYGCSGSGVKYSKRGAAAREFYFASMETPVSELKVGDYAFVSGAALMSAKKFRKILDIKPDTLNPGMVTLELKACSYGIYGSSTMVAVPNEEVRLAKLAAAIAYQSTLNEKGKVKGPRVLAREAKEAAKAAAEKAAEDAAILEMADYYLAA